MDSINLAEVIVPRPLEGPFSYTIPAEFLSQIRVGSVVLVRFHAKLMHGFVVGLTVLAERPQLEAVKLKPIESVLFEEPVFSEQDLNFYRWISEYYQLPLGEVFYSAFPKALLKVSKKNRVSIQSEVFAPAPSLILTEDQQQALQEIENALLVKKFKSFLIFGVTGSGKTEVYIQAAKFARQQGRSALILVPEIALTPQLRERFQEHFQEDVAVLHSSLAGKKRREYWWDVLKGKRKIVVGARSAIFAPLKNVGLIVVDEEHEPSYKQEDHLRYNARDLAMIRAKQHQGIVLLGSATPSIESFYAALQGKYQLLELKSRPHGRTLPQIEIIDLKEKVPAALHSITPKVQKFTKTFISPIMKQRLQEVVTLGEQAMVFINRKGYSHFLLCPDCGYVTSCPNCSVSLTYYQAQGTLRCHYCDFVEKAPHQCPKCASYELHYMGFGAELIEQELKGFLSSDLVMRLDSDTVSTSKKLEEALQEFRAGKKQVLVGTQMLAKGHDFPNVTFVGVVLAEMSLHLPDFRACERTFQLLTQVAGRAGRADKPGRVLIQTYIPEHYVIQTVAQQNYKKFYKTEIQARQEFGYPPFCRIAQLEFRHTNNDRARVQAEHTSHLLNRMGSQLQGLEFLGPAPASIQKINNQYRWHILLKSEKISALSAIMKTLRKGGVRFIDVDPVNTL